MRIMAGTVMNRFATAAAYTLAMIYRSPSSLNTTGTLSKRPKTKDPAIRRKRRSSEHSAMGTIQ